LYKAIHGIMIWRRWFVEVWNLRAGIL